MATTQQAGSTAASASAPDPEVPIGYAAAVAVDGQGDLWVLDNPGRRIWQFDAGGTLLRAWGASGSGPGQFTFPRGMAVAVDGPPVRERPARGGRRPFQADPEAAATVSLRNGCVRATRRPGAS